MDQTQTTPKQKNQQLLLVDVGNSNIVVAITPSASEQDTFVVHRFPTYEGEGKTYVTEQMIYRQIALLLTLAHTQSTDISACVFASVVPQLNEVIKSVISDEYIDSERYPIQEIQPHTQTLMRIDYDVARLGVDRFVNAYAAATLYGTPAIIVDAGTGVTIDCVSQDCVFSGGVIFPGMFVCTEALHTHTAQLPHVTPTKPLTLVGKNTEECILSGVYHQCFGGIVHTVQMMKQLPDYAHAQVVLTGGYSEMFEYDAVFNVCDPLLTMKGLKLMYQRNL